MSATAPPETSKEVTTHAFRLKKAKGETLTMLTAYDYATSRAVDQAGIDSILVGGKFAGVAKRDVNSRSCGKARRSVARGPGKR
jgi:2-methylisocitrate lyase-like PEP mutase family enzyme